jgi:hypothetical protein
MGAIQLLNFIEVNEAIKCFCLSKEPLGRKQVFLAKNMVLQNRFVASFSLESRQVLLLILFYMHNSCVE